MLNSVVHVVNKKSTYKRHPTIAEEEQKNIKLFIAEQTIKEKEKQRKSLEDLKAKLEKTLAIKEAEKKKAVEEAKQQARYELTKKLNPVLINDVNSITYKNKALSDKIKKILTEDEEHKF
jgi:hypothetical protein